MSDLLTRGACLLLCMILMAIIACGGAGEPDGRTSTTEDEVTEESISAESGFRAEVWGAVAGAVEGPGVIRFLPAEEMEMGLRTPGYYFIAGTTGAELGDRDIGITFIVPDAAEPGTYELVSASPLDVGHHFEVRIDHVIDDRVVSYERDTEGSITITSLPPSPAELDGSQVAGRFRFTTRNAEGAEVHAEGSFAFTAPIRVGSRAVSPLPP